MERHTSKINKKLPGQYSQSVLEHSSSWLNCVKGCRDK